MRLVAMVVQKQVVCTQERGASAVVMVRLFAWLGVCLYHSTACGSHEEDFVRKKPIVEPAGERAAD